MSIPKVVPVVTQLEGIDTPSVVIDYAVLCDNIRWMQEKANKYNVRLRYTEDLLSFIRPHIKTHKCIEIGKLQLSHGAVGITCAKPDEALKFMEHNFDSITLAYPIVVPSKLDKLLVAQKRHNTMLRFIVDSDHGVRVMEEAAGRHDTTLNLFVKIDVGLGRVIPEMAPLTLQVGVKESDPRLLPLVKRIADSPRLKFVGLLSHAGQAYGAKTADDIRKIAREERDILMRVKHAIESQLKACSCDPFVIGQVAVSEEDFDGITEIRPGNYVFMDRNQMSKGSVGYSQVAMVVLATVLTVNDNYVIVDAGSKVLSSDLAPHSAADGTVGYGEAFAMDDWGEKRHRYPVMKVSEEHGWLARLPGVEPPEIGSKICIIPNHACPVCNLASEYVVLRDTVAPTNWAVAARGCVK